ncbi:glutathione S-transferase family protein (plasmid) [Agrobacterium tumefaciens]|uniref:Beta-aryl ether-cleaving protein n=2 Tax=Agrobacterium tumefaciens complex TaxID=1183400 RepID=A0A2Z2PT42_9HYPH|nr:MULTISPECIES: glutathione S-transferase family protein [Rhizobium/Agrobacterium group]ASK43514.1 beta-aryl ether-cleaving protein [Agrobacterium radiobacter]ASK44079.1 beta-aryl ether-cleaving protein [Agrobacterium fabrum]ASK46450.1 beta-aryl ether-cleaving protein [Agrobacterium fabrum]NSY04795.1 glutathione S-transferase family protein [Agrobacterium tumefaciens]NTI65910.1 glutathione S-transferase family protein [Rhizobium rhizogenes]
MTIILYDLVGSSEEIRFSPHCWKTRMSLAHKGLEYQTVPTTFVGVPEVEGGVSKTIPVIRDGEQVIADSFAIALYLDEAYPDRPALFEGKGGKSMGRFIERWSQLTLHPYIGVATLMEEVGLLEPESAAYFRKSREAKFGRALEEVARDRGVKLAAFRSALEPLRSMLTYQPFIGGSSPLFPDYIVFGAFQWARTTTTFQVLEESDPVNIWFERCLDLHGGLGRSFARAVWMPSAGEEETVCA